MSDSYPNLLSPLDLGFVTLKNRVLMGSTPPLGWIGGGTVGRLRAKGKIGGGLVSRPTTRRPPVPAVTLLRLASS